MELQHRGMWFCKNHLSAGIVSGAFSVCNKDLNGFLLSLCACLCVCSLKNRTSLLVISKN